MSHNPATTTIMGSTVGGVAGVRAELRGITSPNNVKIKPVMPFIAQSISVWENIAIVTLVKLGSTATTGSVRSARHAAKVLRGTANTTGQ